MNIVNCSKCGKIFNKTISDICPSCMKEIDEQYQKCYKYLRDNKNTTLTELSENTGVPKSLIIKFIYEGRITTTGTKLEYHCDICGAGIQFGKICSKCSTEFQKQLKESNKNNNEQLIQNKSSGYQIKK